MATGTNIRTYYNGTWHRGDIPVMCAADHGAWLGTTVFDGARYFEGIAPDLQAHCDRINRSAEALMITPTTDGADMADIVREGLKTYPADAAVYIRPMYWALEGDSLGVAPKPGATGFAICLEEIPMAAPGSATTMTTTRFRRPTLDCAVVNAKAGCLYPNNARMLAEARAKGFGNALVADALGNVAETATANVFIVKDGEFFTPIANGTFLAGLTRKRHISNLTAAG
ncbi:branched-chain amino acid aminotransferase, partial [Rhodovulum sulfidophilum]|uniref:branched-chain amino acid aminotransferase n=1 Tax=Rhodovulum sulfidophilum TaxID=35806 RepID=UPI0019247C71